MAARKPKPVVAEMEWNEPDPNRITITREQLDAAVTENMKFKLGAGPVEGQLDDLWRRLTQG